jgi:putative transposase
MARRARLVLAGQAHYVIQRGHPCINLFAGANDRGLFLASLREAAAAEGVLLHAYALLEHEVHLLATPNSTSGLGRLVQAVGRRYVSAHNRQHQRGGTLWDGRFRACVVEAGPQRLAVLRLIDGLVAEPQHSSAAHRLGLLGTNASASAPELQELPELWQLGNTPFEREAAYGRLLQQGLPAGVADKLRHAALGGWPLGSAGFVADVEDTTGQIARPRPRGRPSRSNTR